jgi:hypothetical protein
MLVAVMSTCAASAQDSLVRKMPFPFDHMFTIASDVDDELPWHGAAIHALINRKLGLPMASSVWAQGMSPQPSSFFKSYAALNRNPSGVDGLPVFGLLLREWHRGDIDHFHSWQEDGVFRLKNEFAVPVKMSGADIAVPVEAAPVELASMNYQNLRLFFDAPPPADLAIIARDSEGKQAWVNFVAVQRSAATFNVQGGPYVIEAILDPVAATPVNGIAMEPGFRLSQLREISLHAASCKAACTVSLTRVERDIYSRQTVKGQMPWLEAWNVRPLVYTSHGGYTSSQNLSLASAPNYDLPKIYSTDSVVTSLRGQLDDPKNAAFTADYLKRLGVEHLWPFSSAFDHAWNEPRPALSHDGDFYLFSRTRGPDFATDTFDNFRRSLGNSLPNLDAESLSELYCKDNCGSDQGTMLAIALLGAFRRIKMGGILDDALYTHVGTGDEKDWLRTKSQPLMATAVHQLKRLARHYYDFNSDIKKGERIWVPPVSSLARYRVLMAKIEKQITVTGDIITITPRKDEVTGRTIPDLAAGSRDLNGLTIYVADPAKAQVQVGTTKIDSFTRNPPDQTGRPSITLVDDHVPTHIAGALPIERFGPVFTHRAVASGAAWPDVGQQASGGTLKVDLPTEGDGWLTVHPRNLVLDNITHMRLAYRHTGHLPAKGKLFIEMTFEAGNRVTIAEGQDTAPPMDAQSGWWIPVAAGDAFTTTVLPLAGLTWSKSAVPPGAESIPLPLGRIVEIKIGLKGGGNGEGVEIRDLTALRPTGNAISPDGTLLLVGRVTRAGRPQPGVGVRLASIDGTERISETDADGLYFFPGLKKGIPAYVSAKGLDETWCAPEDSTVRDIDRNDVTADVDIATCIALPAQGQSVPITH